MCHPGNAHRQVCDLPEAKAHTVLKWVQPKQVRDYPPPFDGTPLIAYLTDFI